MRKIFTILLCILLSFAMILPVFADGNVTYLGEAERFIFEPGSKDSPTDIFDNFKGVMPGDVLTQKVYINNEVKNDVKIKIYMRSLGAQEGSEDFLSQLKLTVDQDGTSNLFAAPSDETAQLTDWTYLGTVYSGGKITLDVKLEVPAELGNEFQDAIGYLDWEFKIEELPVEPDDPEPPITGDTLRLTLWISLIALTMLALIILFVKRRKKEAENN